MGDWKQIKIETLQINEYIHEFSKPLDKDKHNIKVFMVTSFNAHEIKWYIDKDCNSKDWIYKDNSKYVGQVCAVPLGQISLTCCNKKKY